MTTQTTYASNISPPRAGTIAGQMDAARVTTGICETASPGIPFGRAVSQGSSSDYGIVLGGSLVGLRGVSVRDVTLRGDLAVTDAYLPPNSAAVLEEGDIWVAPGEAVLAHDPVFFNSTTGVFFKATNTGIVGPVPGAYFKTSCGVGGFAILAMAQGGRAAP
jgi:hypothetical protein